MPRVSIVLTTYNRRASLRRALESVLGQTHRDIEILIVDDGSTDGTEETVKETFHDERIRYVRLDQNQGASAARNRGIQEARGEYIMMWDSDDTLYPNALERVLAEFARDPSLSVVSAPARMLIAGQEVPFPRVPSGRAVLEDILCKKIPSNEKIRAARSDVMKSVSYKSRNIDFLVNVELIERGAWYHIDEYLGDVFNDPKGSSLTASRRKKSARASIERAPYLAEFLSRHGEMLKKICASRYSDYCYGAAIGFILSDDVMRGRDLIREAVRSAPRSLTHYLLFILSRLPLGLHVVRLLYR